jgi:hypothetical protein
MGLSGNGAGWAITAELAVKYKKQDKKKNIGHEREPKVLAFKITANPSLNTRIPFFASQAI